MAEDTIRLVNVFTRDFAKSLVLIAPETGMITSQNPWVSQKNACYYGIFLFKLTTKLSSTDIACPFDHRVSLKEREKIEKYQD